MIRLALTLGLFLSGCAVISTPAFTATSYVVQGVKFYFSNYVPSEIVVITTGTGDTKEKAIENALISAVQEAIGVLVVSEVTVQDEKILRNIAIMYSEGVVNKYKIKECKGDLRQTCEVIATVSPSRLQNKFAGSGAVIEVDGQNLYGQYLTSKNAILQRKKLAEYYLSNIRTHGLEIQITSIKVIPTADTKVPIEINYLVTWNREYKENAIAFFKKLEKETNGRFERYSDRDKNKHTYMLTYGDGISFIRNDRLHINTYDESFYKMMSFYTDSKIQISINPFNICDSYDPQYLSGIFAMHKELDSMRKKTVYANPEQLKDLKQISLTLGCKPWQQGWTKP